MSLWVSGEGEEEEVGARRGGSGRKLQLLAGRAETRVKISERRRCWTDVSWEVLVVGMGGGLV